MRRENPIPENKIKTVQELGDLIKNKKTILVASIKNIPGSQFQEIVKKLRSKAIVKVPKKNLIFRALDKANAKAKAAEESAAKAKSSEESDLKEPSEEVAKLKEASDKASLSNIDAVTSLKEKIKDSFTILFSDLDSFELAGELAKNQSPAKAKVGQEAPSDIEIPEGPTELIPGPAISELGALGIKIQIENGKITIKEPKVVAKQGEKISQGAADLMAKLDIKPFKIGFIPLCSFDTQENVLYAEIKVNREETIEDLKNAYGKALSFAVEIGYSTPDTITFLIGKANAHSQVLEKLTPKEEIKKEKPSEEEKKEGEKENDAPEDNKEENK